MADSNFPFVSDTILRKNMDVAFDHIVGLIYILDSEDSSVAKSSYRKTIIIHTASIIEALLFHLLDRKHTDEDVAKFYRRWELKNMREICVSQEGMKIVWGEYVQIDSNTSKDKLNLSQIQGFLTTKEVLDSELNKNVDYIRNLRNKQHLSTQKEIKTYTNSDLNKAFDVAKKVKEFVNVELSEDKK